MKTLFCVAVFALLYHTCPAQKKVQNDWQKNRMQGKVKYTRYSSYIFMFDKVYNGESGIDPLSYNVDTFTTAGYNVKFYHVDSGKVTNQVTYKHNGKGMRTEKLSDDGAKTVYEYDAKGNQVKVVSYSKGKESTKALMKYDAQGNMTEMETIGFMDMKKVYKNDSKGNAVEIYNYDKEGKPLGKLVNTYDDNGNNTVKENYDKDGTLKSKTYYKYDEHGNEIERTEYDAVGNQTRQDENIYTYDSNGNWLSQIRKHNGKVDFVYWREVYYY